MDYLAPLELAAFQIAFLVACHINQNQSLVAKLQLTERPTIIKKYIKNG